jgi:hypothetical protein
MLWRTEEENGKITLNDFLTVHLKVFFKIFFLQILVCLSISKPINPSRWTAPPCRGMAEIRVGNTRLAGAARLREWISYQDLLLHCKIHRWASLTQN